MKRSILLLVFGFYAFLITRCAGPNSAKGMAKEALASAVSSAVESKRFEFRAMSATTQRGRTVNLTSTYNIVVKPDVIVCDLPFFGTSFAGSAYGGEGGIRFESKQFEWTSTASPKGGWYIVVLPKDKPEVQKIELTVGAGGYTTVNITNTNRSPMRYYGNLIVAKN